MRLLLLLAAALPAAAEVDFAKEIQPLLERHCLGCHGAGRGLGGLRLHTRDAALKQRAVVPGNPDASLLVLTMDIAPGKPAAMPPGGPQVPAEARTLIRQWIAEGAKWPAGLEIGKLPAKPKDDLALAEKLAAKIASPTEFKRYQQTIPNTVIAYEMVPVPGGEFVMGSPATEAGRNPDEGPQRKLKVEPFWMGKYEVTWDEYRLFMFQNLSNEKAGADTTLDAISRPTKPYVEMSFGMGINGYPAISMTQHAANKYAQWLSAKTGHFYRLPTEAEWEYACRAGTTTPYSFGAAPIGDYAWLESNSNGKYEKVGQKKPNPFGLHDMHGNVAEWVLDQYDAAAYGKPLPAEGYVPSKTPYPHVSRGGSWADDAARLRCAARASSDESWKMQDPQLPKSIWYLTDAQFQGFRLVRPFKKPTAQQMFRYWNNGVERE